MARTRSNTHVFTKICLNQINLAYLALPALAELTQASVGVGEQAQLKRPRNSLPNYGFAPIPNIVIEYKYPRAVYFILATKFFEAFAANGMRSK